MKTIKDFLEADDSTEETSNDGVFTDWLEFLDPELKGNTLQFVETRVLGSRGNDQHECVEIPVTPGIFHVQAKAVNFGNDKRIAGLRAFAKGSAPSKGRKIGDISVDMASISVLDIDRVWKTMNEMDEDSYTEWLEEILFSDDCSQVRVHEWEATKSKIPTVGTGFGDGVYDVCELTEKGKVIGLETVFISHGKKYTPE